MTHQTPTPLLSAEDRTALRKLHSINFRAQAAGAALRELRETQRELKLELRQVHAFAQELSTELRHPQGGDVERVDPDNTRDRKVFAEFITSRDASRKATGDRQRADNQRAAEFISFRLELIDVEITTLQPSVQSLNATREALAKHLTDTGVLKNGDLWQ